MTPGARLQAAIEVVDAFLRPGETAMADRLLAAWARGARYAGSKDRAAVADHVYAALRRLESARLGAPSAGAGRAAALGALRLELAEAGGAGLEAIAALADGGPHRPAPLSEAERDWLEALPARAAAAPLADFPDVAAAEIAASGLDPAAEFARSRRRAAFDLRVNTLKAERDEAIAALAEEGVEAYAGPLAPTALRVAAGAAARPKLRRLSAFQAGLVEPQDAGSQAAALLAAAAFRAVREDQPGGLVLDLCAGGGGKTLALAAASPGGARLGAFDVAPERMAALPERLARAGASAEIMDRRALAALGASADLALIDAPCSGSGAWARRPDAKWRLTPERLQALRAAQGEALRLGAASVRKGGALVYVTCSLFHSENHGAVAAFLAERPGFAPLALSPLWRRAGLAPEHAPPPRGGDPLEAASLQLSPALHGTDGFHLCALRRVLD